MIDPFAKVRPNAAGDGLELGGVKFDINPFDEIAVEEAVRQREAGADFEIVVVAVGGEECEEQLRKALAMGADRAIRIEAVGEDLDPGVVADELKALALELDAGLVLMGKQSTDGDNNQVGQMLAAKLGWPQATFAAKLEMASDSVTVTRETDEGEEVLKAPLPCVVTTDLRLNEPRYIPLPGIIKARSKPLDVRQRATSSSPRVQITKVEAAPERPPGRMVESVDELVSAIKGAI